MPATIQIYELTTNATTGVDKTSGTVRFKNVASTTSTAADASDPIPIPAAGSNYSYVKKLRAYMSVAPDTSVSNLEWYMAAGNTLGTGITMTAKNIGTTFGTHYQTLMADGADLFSYLTGARLNGDGTDTGPFLPADNISHIGDIIELQMAVASTASSGAKTAQTLTLSYDEV